MALAARGVRADVSCGARLSDPRDRRGKRRRVRGRPGARSAFGHEARSRGLQPARRNRRPQGRSASVQREAQAEIQGPLRAAPKRTSMDIHFLFRLVERALLVASIAGCSGMIASDYRAIVANPDRSEGDRQTDQRRNPELLLAFTSVRPCMRALDIGAGPGYSTELIARAVGSGGTVYAQDSQAVSPRARERFDERARTPAMQNVVRVLRDYDDSVPSR